MNRIRNLVLAASAVIPAAAMFGGTAFAGDDAAMGVTYKDLVNNGKFNTNTLGWTPGDYAQIAAKEGNALVYNTMPVAGVTSTREVTQCVEITPNSQPTFKGSIFIPAGQVRTGSASFKLTYYKNDDCTNFKGNSQVPALVSTGEWRTTQFTLDAMTAKDAKSVLIAMQVTKNNTAPKNRGKKFVAVFDNIKLLEKVDPIQPDDDDDDFACTDICADDDDAPPPPPPAVEPDDSEDEPVAEEEPADLPGGDEAEDQGAETPDDDTPAGDDQGSDDEGDAGSDDDSDDAPEGGSESPTPGAGGSNQPGSGSGNNPSSNGGAPTSDKLVEATGGNAKVVGGESGKPNTNTNGGNASQTPLAPETGSNAQAADADSSSATLFGLVAGSMAALCILFGVILKRRGNRRDA